VSRPLREEGLGAGLGFSEGGLRLRGTGGGIMGRSSYIYVSSARVGIGVVRALGGRKGASSVIATGFLGCGEAACEDSLDDHD
jgi:hypothetical protein